MQPIHRPVPSPPKGRFDLDRHKESVARDLEAQLNARSLAVDVRLVSCARAGASFLGCGISDPGSLSLIGRDHRLLLRDELRAAIGRHEPRLSQVRVHLYAARDGGLRFRVEAMLEVHPRRPPVAFDALLSLAVDACRADEA